MWELNQDLYVSIVSVPVPVQFPHKFCLIRPKTITSVCRADSYRRQDSRMNVSVMCDEEHECLMLIFGLRGIFSCTTKFNTSRIGTGSLTEKFSCMLRCTNHACMNVSIGKMGDKERVLYLQVAALH